MFERYTEKARRVIFFARYEASQFGSPYIETEHILLGLLRENRALVARVLRSINYNSAREQIVANSPIAQKTSVSVDLPLSNESKRVLAYAAEEAERLSHRHIGSEHLLLGLLRENQSYAAHILSESGADLSNLRLAIAKLPEQTSGTTYYRKLGDEPQEALIKIHDEEWSAGYVQAAAKGWLRFFWNKQEFKAPDIVIHRADDRISFDSKLAQNSADFELSAGGWKEETCRICYWQFEESDDPQRSAGYTNGRDWLCLECYERFVTSEPAPKPE